MTREPRWISKKALLLLHQESLATFGGPPGIRDEELLDSALARPRNAYAYQPESSIADLAAAYVFGLAKNHPFVDGNKRVAFLSLGIFLRVNGHRLTATQVDAIQAILAVAAGDVHERGLAAWIQANMSER